MPARAPWAAVALAAASLVQLTQAQAAETKMGETVVTAARMSQSMDNVTSDVTVVDKAAIERSGAVGIADVLVRLPGVQINRNGGVGQSTSVYLRGTFNQHALVLVDGMRFGSQELQGGAAWANLPLAQIERIEVLRGPAAAIYGSDAMGGVIQIFTRKGMEGPAKPYVEIGVGTHSTSKAAAGLSGGESGWTYAINLADERSDGFDVQSPFATNPDKDGYANSSASFNLGYRHDKHALETSLRHNRFKAHYDYSGAPSDDYDVVKTTAGSLKWTSDWSDVYRSVVQLSRTQVDTNRHIADAESTKGRSDGLLWQNIWKLGEHRVNVDFERTVDHLDTNYVWTQNTDSKRTQNAVALGWSFTSGAHSLNAHVRHDNVKDQQSKTTGGLGYGLQINDSLRWVASAGTAFRTPTLYERFTGQAAADLRPESSRNIETGLQFETEAYQLSAMIYRNKFRDLITYDWNSSNPCYCYRNVDRAQMTGLTLAGSTRLDAWNIGASVDFLNPKDLDKNKLLTHRAKRSFKLNADTKVAGWTLGGEALLYSQRQINVDNTEQLPGYGVFNLYMERALTKDWSLLARLDNVADKDYQLAKGYATAGRTVFVSLKWSPR